MNGHSKFASVTSVPLAGDGVASEVARERPERRQSSRSRRDHNRSQSRNHQAELRTVGEYALHHLFNSFVAEADQKINQCIGEPGGPEPQVELICGPDVDPNFDQLISALGHIARQKPKALIDTLMFWRKSKSEAANNARSDYNIIGSPQSQAFSNRRNDMPIVPERQAADISGSWHQNRQAAIIQAERRSTVSIYLLCRVLIEIISQSNLQCITPEMAERLEDIIYTQLTAPDIDVLEESPLKKSNWIIFGQLLGVMSEINFGSVSSRFIQDLERLQRQMDAKGANREVEGKAILVVRGMKYLRIKHQPEDAWSQSCDFMQALAKLFANAHGQILKYEFCSLLKDLLLPLASKATSELNMPKWRTFLETCRPRVFTLLAKSKHWQDAFPLLCALTCASPFDIFSSHWLQLILPLGPKLKEVSTRAMALRGICRLIWTYLYRLAEPQNVVNKRLEEIIRLVFVHGRKSYLTTETAIAEPFIQLARIIGYKNQEVCFRSIIFPLMNSDVFTSGKELRPEMLEPERMVIGIRAFLAIMADLETGEAPAFPIAFDKGFGLEPDGVVPSPLSPKNLIQVPSKSTTVKEERLSRPVMVTSFGDVAKESYIKFCKILGEITMLCDNAFGGQAVLDEKFSMPVPKTPMTDAFTFGRREDHSNSPDFRQGFYDLLHVAVQALPRCLSAHIPFNSLVNLLCTGTAHMQSTIATSSAQSLKSIARQSHAQQVTIGFARFIFNFDDRYGTVSDGGMLGPGHIESTLRLYIELLQIWIEEIKRKAKKAASDSFDDSGTGGLLNRSAQLDISSIWAHVDEIESHGLFFLCSPSRRVRTFAVTVLQLITEFDIALGSKAWRIIRILEGPPHKVMDVNDERLTVQERSRLRGMQREGSKSTHVDLCSSDAPVDVALWSKLFPNLVGLLFESCPLAGTLTRELICGRLPHTQKVVAFIADGARGSPHLGSDYSTKSSGKTQNMQTSSPDLIIEQWQLHLIYACRTLTNAGPHQQLTAQHSAHNRKSSKSSQNGLDKIQTASELFGRIIPFLWANNGAVRDAAVLGLGSVNINLYATLLESLQSAVDESRIRLGLHQRTVSSPRRNKRVDHLRNEVAHVYKLTSHFLRQPEAYQNEWILSNLVTYTKDLRIFLNDAEVQSEWEYQKLRTHFCGLIEELFEGINRTAEPMRWMPFQARKAAFALLEEWSGFSPNQTQMRQREDSIRRSMLEREADIGNKSSVTAQIEIEKRNLRTAALSGMAALCGGPLIITTDSGVNLQFDIRRLLSWVENIFDTPSDKTHATGRKALTNLIMYNRELSYLLTHVVEMCYVAKSTKARESYFEVVSQILAETNENSQSQPFWKVLGACLYILGNENNELRMKAARLLRNLDKQQQRKSKLQDLDISIADKTIAVYKNAQFEISRRLAKTHSELAFLVFSELSCYFRELQPDHQRSMVAVILPWIQIIELQVDPNGGPTANSYMVLVNLFEITVRCGNALHNEIQALWQALASGPGGNVQLILDFIISLCLERREHYVHYAKQIVVYLSTIPAGLKVIEFLLMQINPKAMIQEKRELTLPPQDVYNLPYVADLSLVITSNGKQTAFSLGQLCLMLLVDLIVSPVKVAKEHVTLLLHVVLTLWDHYLPMMQDQAREMLVHLIHELVISELEDTVGANEKSKVEDLIEQIRSRDVNVVWSYDDYNGAAESFEGNCVPDTMKCLVDRVLDTFSKVYPTIREDWGKLTLEWATSCSVRHVACRSLQLFRCILSKIDQSLLGDVLVRLSNTIADDENDVQTFSLEILTTLRVLIEEFDEKEIAQFPQLFWVTCACLDTIHEREFLASISMLDKLLDKLDLMDPATVQLLTDSFPPNWEGTFAGLQGLIFKGAKSSICLDQSLKLLERLLVIPANNLVGDETRLAFTLLANLPRYLSTFGSEPRDPAISASAETLRKVAENQGCAQIARILGLFAQARYRIDQDFLSQTMSAVRSSFFPQLEYESLIFLIGLLSNKIPWFKVRVMEILCCVLPDMDLRKPEIVAKGPDLISPLLRLLQTEFCPQALRVLDNVMYLAGAPTPQDKAHLRMSMVGSHASRAFRKEYDRTQSLYGIPEETGWSIPVPAVQSLSTRRNCHMVFYTCTAAQNASEGGDAETPKVEFSEDYQYPGYFPDYRTATMSSEDTRSVGGVGGGEGHMGELVMKLDSLDDFFDEDADVVTPILRSTATMSRFHSSQGVGPNGNIGNGNGNGVDVRETVYEQQTLPILHKSLTRNASVSSFQNGFADLKGTSTRDPGIMTPTAFTTAAAAQNSSGNNGLMQQHQHQHQPQPEPRPAPLSRAVTSPVLAQPGASASTANLTADGFNVEDLVEDAFSDGDEHYHTINNGTRGGSSRRIGAIGNSGDRRPVGHVSHDKSSSLENIVRPFTSSSGGGGLRGAGAGAGAGSVSGFRSGVVRRLTGGAGDAKEREKARELIRMQLQKSPQVPKVPDMYLSNPRSSEL